MDEQGRILADRNQCTTAMAQIQYRDLAARALPLPILVDTSAVMVVQFCSLVSLYPTMLVSYLVTDDVSRIARALYSYNAAIPEELGFSKGDILAVLRLQDDGWWEAEVTGSRGHPGLVPSNYLQSI
jgi:hypothetical protein